jgi:uncharacterized protein
MTNGALRALIHHESRRTTMKTFAAIITAAPGYVERRQPYRTDHLSYLSGLKDAGKVMLAGALADPVDGALIVYVAESLSEAERLIQADPYYRAGLWPEMRIRELTIVIS